MLPLQLLKLVLFAFAPFFLPSFISVRQILK
jgi:hypothetical protein